MTDELTDAVRRLKELQADVERLKAGDDQRGVPRLLFSQSETALGSDRIDISTVDLQQSEVAEADDTQTDLRFQGRTRAGYQSRGRYGIATYTTEERFERFETRRNVSLGTERELVVADVGSRNSVGLEIRATTPVDIVVLVEQSGTGPLTAATLTDRNQVSEEFRVPDADTVRVFLTNTGVGVADVLLGTTQ